MKSLVDLIELKLARIVDGLTERPELFCEELTFDQIEAARVVAQHIARIVQETVDTYDSV